MIIITKFNKKGFTLIELMVTLTILGILAAILVPSFTQYINKAKKGNVIVGGRTAYQAAQVLATDNYASGHLVEPTEKEVKELAEVNGNIDQMYFDLYSGKVIATASSPFVYSENGEKATYADGKWYVGDEIPTGEVTGGGTNGGNDGDSGGGSGGSGGAYGDACLPGTSIFLDINKWPIESEYIDNIYGTKTIEPGGIFKYTDGNYYVVTKKLTLTMSQALSGPGGEVYGWFSSQKITGRIIENWEIGNPYQYSDLQRGDIVKDNNSYYVYIDGGSWGRHPLDNPQQWYKLP